MHGDTIEAVTFTAAGACCSIPARYRVIPVLSVVEPGECRLPNPGLTSLALRYLLATLVFAYGTLSNFQMIQMLPALL